MEGFGMHWDEDPDRSAPMAPTDRRLIVGAVLLGLVVYAALTVAVLSGGVRW